MIIRKLKNWIELRKNGNLNIDLVYCELQMSQMKIEARLNAEFEKIYLDGLGYEYRLFFEINDSLGYIRAPDVENSNSQLPVLIFAQTTFEVNKDVANKVFYELSISQSKINWIN